MSEKRFILDSDFVKITSQVAWDNQTEKGLTFMKIVGLLNEQQSVIDKQNQRIRKLENILKKFQFPVERV